MDRFLDNPDIGVIFIIVVIIILLLITIYISLIKHAKKLDIYQPNLIYILALPIIVPGHYIYMFSASIFYLIKKSFFFVIGSIGVLLIFIFPFLKYIFNVGKGAAKEVAKEVDKLAKKGSGETENYGGKYEELPKDIETLENSLNLLIEKLSSDETERNTFIQQILKDDILSSKAEDTAYYIVARFIYILKEVFGISEDFLNSTETSFLIHKKSFELANMLESDFEKELSTRKKDEDFDDIPF